MIRRIGSVLGLYALLLQVFWPLAAAAAVAAGPAGFPVQICTPQGLLEISDGAVVPDGKSLPSGAPHVHHCLFCSLAGHASGILNAGLAVPVPVSLAAAPFPLHHLAVAMHLAVAASHPRGPPHSA